MAANILKTSSFKRCSSAPDCNDTTSTNTAQMNNQTTGSTSREQTPPATMNIFTPRARRYSTSFSQLGTTGAGPRLTPRVSQLRQEECADLSNSREVLHEREIHTAIQISQSWEDLTLDAENWSFKNDTDLTNPLHVTLPTGVQSCSSPSPTSRAAAVRLPYGLSPSPTRRTFATRRSMSPIAMRPSTLGPVKRKFELDDNTYGNSYSPPPFKKMFSERGTSPICQSPSLSCPSPDSTEGRTTPKFYVSKLYATSTNSSSSVSSSPSAPSPSMEMQIDLPTMNSCSNSNEPIINQPDESQDAVDCDDAELKQLNTLNAVETRSDFTETSNGSNGSMSSNSTSNHTNTLMPIERSLLSIKRNDDDDDDDDDDDIDSIDENKIMFTNVDDENHIDNNNLNV